MGSNFLKYYNKEDREENVNKKVKYFIIYDRLIMKTQLVINKNIKIFIDIDRLTKLIKKRLIKEL